MTGVKLYRAGFFLIPLGIVKTSMRLSVIIITRDEVHRIGRAIDALAFADEIVVLDSGSTDGTREVARAAGARVEQTDDWPGFGRQKNRVLDLARGDWILSIDADELVTEALADAILEAIRPPFAEVEADADADANVQAPVAWWIERRSRWCGRPVRFGDWRRDRVLRLFRRGAARFSDDIVHERVVCDGIHGQLAGWLWHDTVDTPEDGTEKALRYARLGAERLRQRGRGGRWSALWHAGGGFVRGYVLRLGCLDGLAGWAIASTNAYATWLRYRLAADPDFEATLSKLR
jgi:glycosyltransferase involved in cell wall biosynthesis